MALRPRGFVMVVVLAVVALIVAILGAMLSAKGQSKKLLVNQVDDTQARGIAEMCLSKGVAVAIAHFENRGGEDFDFDQLLDPDRDPASGDEYVFNEAGSSVQQVPSDNTDSFHRFSFVRVSGGACYIRYDDNNDDSLPGYTAQTSNTPNGSFPVLEGPSASGNVPFRDRDASIQVTAIGVYPAHPGTSDADVYDRAHARVTMRQIFTTAAAPAVYSNGNVTVGADVEFCGTGGIRGVDINVDPTSCICGDAFARQLTPSTMAECSPAAARCPDPTGPNDIDAIPQDSAAEFPTRCAVFGLTEGETPPILEGGDTVADFNYNPLDFEGTFGTPINYGTPECRFFLRNDGDVFLWDGRLPNSDQQNLLTATRCDLTGEPPVFTASQKDAACAAIQPGASCAITNGSDRDQEFCNFSADPGPAPPATRCDLLNTVSPPWPPSPTDAQKHAVCDGTMSGGSCGVTSSPTDIETCVPPLVVPTGLNCTPGNEAGNAPPPLAGWTDINMSMADVDALPSSDVSSHCWRLVAELDGTSQSGAADAAGGAAPEWEGGGGLALTTARVPNLRATPHLEIRDGSGNVVPPRIEDVCSFRHPKTAAAGLNPVNHPVLSPPRPIVTRSAGVWSIPGGWENELSNDRRLPTPSVLVVQGNVNVGGGTHLDGVTLAVAGSVRVQGGGGANGTVLIAADTLGHHDNDANNPLRYAGRTAGCTREIPGLIPLAWQPGNTGFRSRTTRAMPFVSAAGAETPVAPVPAATRFAIRATGDCTVSDEVSVFGKIGCAGDLRIAAAESCFVGGLSSAGGLAADASGSGLSFSPDCSSGTSSSCAAEDLAVCIEQQVSVIGDVFAVGDISIPHGIFISRGSQRESRDVIFDIKGGRVLSHDGDICLNGPARIIGQVVSGRIGGDVQIGNNVFFMQSGEVGVGFTTKRAVWSDNSW